MPNGVLIWRLVLLMFTAFLLSLKHSTHSNCVCLCVCVGTILDSVVCEVSPGSALELGTYCGYSTVRIARLLPPGTKLITVEFNPDFAKVARQVIEFAGLQDKVREMAEFMKSERKKVLVFVQRWFVVWHIQVLHFANVCCIIFQFISVFNYELLQSTKALYLCKTLKCQTHFKDVISSHVCLCI